MKIGDSGKSYPLAKKRRVGYVKHDHEIKLIDRRLSARFLQGWPEEG